MPNIANSPAPTSEPAMRAESWVVREMPIAGISPLSGMVSAISALRIVWSEGRSSPEAVAIRNTCSGRNAPLTASPVITSASTP